MSDNKEVKQFLGINSSNITSVLPINITDFNIWVLCTEDYQIVGFLSFLDKDNDVKYKCQYINGSFQS
jgi:hypothetical protein